MSWKNYFQQNELSQLAFHKWTMSRKGMISVLQPSATAGSAFKGRTMSIMSWRDGGFPSKLPLFQEEIASQRALAMTCKRRRRGRYSPLRGRSCARFFGRTLLSSVLVKAFKGEL